MEGGLRRTGQEGVAGACNESRILSLPFYDDPVRYVVTCHLADLSASIINSLVASVASGSIGD